MDVSGALKPFFNQLDGVIEVVSGYANFPSQRSRPYMEVKTQKTGAVEAVKITYDDSVVHFK